MPIATPLDIDSAVGILKIKFFPNPDSMDICPAYPNGTQVESSRLIDNPLTSPVKEILLGKTPIMFTFVFPPIMF